MKVILRADSGREQGTGHVMRMLTLAEALRSRNHEVLLASSEVSIPWLRNRIAAQNLPIHTTAPDSLDADDLHQLGADVLVFDGYRFLPDSTAQAQDRFTATLAVIDGDALGYHATLYLDQNPGADTHSTLQQAGRLAGPRFALIRSEILEQRHHTNEFDVAKAEDSPVSLLAVFGGSDPFGAARVVFEVLARSESSFAATVIDASIGGPFVPSTPDPRISVHGPIMDLARAMGSCTIAISAAGTTALDLLACGVPTAIIEVAHNQAGGYRAMAEQRLAYPLGALWEIKADVAGAAAKLDSFLQDADRQRAQSLRGLKLVDGRGAQRVAAALEQAVAGAAAP